MRVMQDCDTVSSEAHGCQNNEADQKDSVHIAHIGTIVASTAMTTVMTTMETMLSKSGLLGSMHG